MIQILYADDSKEWIAKTRKYFGRKKNKTKYSLATAQNKDEVLEITKSKPFDLVILDELQRDCFDVIVGLGKHYQGKVVIYTGDVQVLSAAKSRNIPNYDKLDRRSMDNILMTYFPQ